MCFTENKTGLAEDMKFLASMPELCDVTFLVGDTREPVCAVKVRFCNKNRILCFILNYNLLLILGCAGGKVPSFPENVISSSITTTQEGTPTA